MYSPILPLIFGFSLQLINLNGVSAKVDKRTSFKLKELNAFDKNLITTEINNVRDLYALGKLNRLIKINNMELVEWNEDLEKYAKVNIEEYEEKTLIPLELAKYSNLGEYFYKENETTNIENFIIDALGDFLNYTLNNTENGFYPNFNWIGCSIASFEEITIKKVSLKCIYNRIQSEQINIGEPCSECKAKVTCNGLVYDGLCGLTGPRGEKGEMGISGEKGIHGSVGDKGMKGEIGTEGKKGMKGEFGKYNVGGAVGEKGDTGEPGDAAKGTKGSRGPKGSKGSRGIKGEIGERGPIGEENFVVSRDGEFYEDYIFWLLFSIPLIGIFINIFIIVNIKTYNPRDLDVVFKRGNDSNFVLLNNRRTTLDDDWW